MIHLVFDSTISSPLVMCVCFVKGVRSRAPALCNVRGSFVQSLRCVTRVCGCVGGFLGIKSQNFCYAFFERRLKAKL